MRGSLSLTLTITLSLTLTLPLSRYVPYERQRAADRGSVHFERCAAQQQAFVL